ncbi:phage portal protein [Cetobacterium somerae]|uniref:phage portal protein n=1 Tax=Cetobacterium somerae TaxID=188913 RepID=UPI00211E3548|nr:phage portal protein [Cetobacterium somerae]MCQ9628101.1 phage portal protein [Cetobacterium somerae]
MGMTYKDIEDNISKYIEEHKKKISTMEKYRQYSKNKVGRFHKDRVIRNLRMCGKIQDFISSDGYLIFPGINGTNYTTQLTVEDILVEDTLPKTSIETLKKYSVGEKPKIIVNSEEDRKWIKDFERREKIHNKLKKLTHDSLVVGDSFFKVEEKDGKAKIILLKKENIIIVPDNWDDSEAGLYIYVVKKNKNGKEYLHVEIFEPDGKVHVLNNYEGKKFKKVDERKVKGDVDLGLGEFNIHHIQGIYEDETSLYSNSIYEGLTSTFVELTTRNTAISIVLNKYGNPRLVGADDLTEEDEETGEKIVKLDTDYIQSSDPENAAAYRYLTPPADFINTSFPHTDRMLKNAYSQLGVNEISLGLSQEGGIVSGEAFKKAITPTLNACRDIANNLYVPVIKMYQQAYKIETGKELEIEIEFQDGISLSEKEIIENEKALVEAKLISRTTILKNRGIKNPKKELKLIAEEQKILDVFENTEIDIPSGDVDE